MFYGFLYCFLLFSLCLLGAGSKGKDWLVNWKRGNIWERRDEMADLWLQSVYERDLCQERSQEESREENGVSGYGFRGRDSTSLGIDIYGQFKTKRWSGKSTAN